MSNDTTNEPASAIEPGYCHCGCGQKTPIINHNDKSKGWVKGEPLRYIVGHYGASSKHSSPLDAFLSKMGDRNGDGCWLWPGCVSEKGYGVFSYKCKTYHTHRVSWEVHFGPIPDGLFVCHNCPGGDNPRCCNPDHLFLGTHLDNMKDKDNKGRTPKGQDSGQSKLKESDVIEIRSLIALGESQSSVARKYSISPTAVFYIAHRITWKHIA